MNAAQVFENPLQQTYQMEQRLNQHLKSNVADEVLAYVRIKSNEKYNAIYNTLLERVDKIDKIYETKAESKSEYFEKMQHFLQVTNPSELASELKRLFSFNEVEAEYNNLISFFSKREFGKFYLRYQFDKSSFQGLTAGLLSDIQMIHTSLEDYANSVGDHLNVMKSIKESAGVKTFFKVGTKIAGSLLGGPLGSIAGGALANALIDDDSKISQSYGNVLDAWSHYLSSLDDFLNNLRDRYEHVLLTLIGGLFIRVSGDLKNLHVSINELALLEYGINYGISPFELQKYQTWMTTTTNGIAKKIKEKQFEFALKAANELFQFVQQNELLKIETYRDKQSYFYTAALYKYAAISSYAWSIKDKEKFSSIVYELFKHMPLLLQEKDLKRIKVPTQIELSMMAVSYWLEEGTFGKKTVVLPDLLQRTLERYENKGSYLGEPEEEDLYTYFTFVIGKRLCTEYDQKQYKFFVKKTSLDTKTLKKLIGKYKEVTGKEKDDFIESMKVMILSRWVGMTRHFLRKRVVWVPSLVLVLGLSIWGFRDSWLPIFESKLNLFQTVQTNTEVTQSVEVVTASSTVRSEPDLNGSVVTSVASGETYGVLEEENDAEGRLWYKIQMRDQVGWIREKTVKLIAE